jgi:GDP-L-fucose synthase
LVADVVGYGGSFVFATSESDGAAQKLLDISEPTRLGWRAKMPLREGIAAAYADFLATAGHRELKAAPVR